MLEKLDRCDICPHNCNINRNKGEIGRCKSTNKIKIALYSIHKFEEPCISGDKGSGTVFFSNCNMNCIYCQNYEISQLGKGKEITIEELAQIFLKQQEKGVENINLVTPTSYIPQIIESIKLAKNKGLSIPIVYNTNGYEKIETLKLLEGYIDVYLPDLKYAENDLGLKYSKVNNYFEIATKAIKEMARQAGAPKFNENLPEDIYVSIMAKYFPTYKAKNVENLNRKLTKEEWEEIENYIEELNIENGYIQELGEHEEEYVPKWEFE